MKNDQVNVDKGEVEAIGSIGMEGFMEALPANFPLAFVQVGTKENNPWRGRKNVLPVVVPKIEVLTSLDTGKAYLLSPGMSFSVFRNAEVKENSLNDLSLSMETRNFAEEGLSNIAPKEEFNLAKIFADTHTPMASFDIDFKLRAWNKAFHQLMTDRGVGQITLGDSIQMICDHEYDPQCMDQKKESLKRVLEGESVHEELTYLINKEEFYYEIHLFPLMGQHGEVLGGTAIMHRATSHKLSEKKLQKMTRNLEEMVRERTEELERANEYMESFVFATAHDLRSPIANLKQISELMRLRDKQKGPIVEKLCISVDRLDRVVSGLIKLLDAQKIENFIIETLRFENIFSLLLPDLKAKSQNDFKILAHFQVEEMIYVEPFLLIIMKNLIENAIKYASEDRDHVVKVRTSQEGEFVVLSVEDNGIGIDLPTAGTRLFRPFKRLTNKGNGYGIGLHLVKRMVEKNGGRIEVNSSLGVGSTFNIYLKPYKFNF